MPRYLSGMQIFSFSAGKSPRWNKMITEEAVATLECDHDGIRSINVYLPHAYMQLNLAPEGCGKILFLLPPLSIKSGKKFNANSKMSCTMHLDIPRAVIPTGNKIPHNT
ncbi:hypothetical protein DL98DRAFT_45022 [Cadophora sp. DSE1049]|nr:hypothetical protein DL98DRAFT_45022 [Cadophora sp. DSE1049]